MHSRTQRRKLCMLCIGWYFRKTLWVVVKFKFCFECGNFLLVAAFLRNNSSKNAFSEAKHMYWPGILGKSFYRWTSVQS